MNENEERIDSSKSSEQTIAFCYKHTMDSIVVLTLDQTKKKIFFSFSPAFDFWFRFANSTALWYRSFISINHYTLFLFQWRFETFTCDIRHLCWPLWLVIHISISCFHYKIGWISKRSQFWTCESVHPTYSIFILLQMKKKIHCYYLRRFFFFGWLSRKNAESIK